MLIRRKNSMQKEMNSTQLCRLCLESSADVVNTFEKFQDSTIASVLAEHFWFQINKNDGMSEWVCETCWSQTKTFHNFYKKLELLHQNYLNSIVLVKVDDIKRERSVSPVEETPEDTDLFADKYEGDADILIKTDYTQTLSKENSCDEDNNDKSCDQSEAEQTTDDEDQLSPNKPNNTLHSKSEKEKQDADIRTFFTMKCEICKDNVDFDTLKNVRKHWREVHKKKCYLTCCGNKYRTRWSMLDHVQYHINPDAHRCDQCGKSFRERKSLRTHMQCHVRAHKCSLCPSTFPYAVKLKYHVRDKHSTDTSVKFHCDQCGKTYPTKLSLTGHIRNVHDKSLEHVCEVCGRIFKQKFNLQIHKKLEHSATPLPKVQCDICGTWLKHERRLQKHLELHQEAKDAQEGKAKVLNCPICKKKVQNKRLLTHHISHSHGARNHKCTFCDKAFRRLKNLQEHTALHTGVDLYSCLYCDRTFKSNANMYSHRKKAHLAEWTRDREEKNRGNQVDATETETTSKNANK